nr:MAG TPA: Non-structural protein 4B protein [Caudoviricetes sp.]
MYCFSTSDIHLPYISQKRMSAEMLKSDLWRKLK